MKRETASLASGYWWANQNFACSVNRPNTDNCSQSEDESYRDEHHTFSLLEPSFFISFHRRRKYQDPPGVSLLIYIKSNLPVIAVKLEKNKLIGDSLLLCSHHEVQSKVSDKTHR